MQTLQLCQLLAPKQSAQQVHIILYIGTVTYKVLSTASVPALQPLLDVLLFTRSLSRVMGYKGQLGLYGYYVAVAWLLRALAPPLAQMTAQESALVGSFRCGMIAKQRPARHHQAAGVLRGLGYLKALLGAVLCVADHTSLAVDTADTTTTTIQCWSSPFSCRSSYQVFHASTD